MTAAIGKYAARKLLSKELKKYSDKKPAGQKDPFYEYRVDPRTGKEKKYKKQIPSYIPEHDAAILASVRKSAYRLDMALFTLFGLRFGWESVIGLIPVVGDILGAFFAMMVFKKCCKVEGGLPSGVQSQMMFWIAVDALVGMIPFVGDLLDASIKCNTNNCRLLEEHLDKKYRPAEMIQEDKRKSTQGIPPPAPATVYEDFDSDEDLPQYTTAQSGSRQDAIRPPQPARVPEERRGGVPTAPKGRQSWFGGRGGSRRERPVDDEMAGGSSAGVIRQ